MIKLPQKAIRYLDAEADRLSFLIKPYTNFSEKSNLANSRSEEYSHNIPPEMVLSHSKTGLYDGFGNQVAMFFQYKDKSVGFSDDDYLEFNKFVEQIFNKKAVNIYLSEEYIRKIALKFFECKYKGEISQDDKFSDYLLKKSQNAIKKIKISIPISYLAIEESFNLADIKYEYYDAIFFDKLFSVYKRNNTEASVEKFDQNIRKKYQGIVFASKELYCEIKRAVQKTIEEVEAQLKLIRCFSPTTFLPQIESYFSLMGQAIIPQNHYFIFEKDIPTINTELQKVQDYYFTFSKKQLSDYVKSGYIKIFQILSKTDKSNLEDILLNVAFLFSRSIESKLFQDKLVYTLVALETLLLKGGNEPIQKSLGQRLAFLTQDKPEKRKDVAELVKKIYALRSAYIHHGKKKENLEALGKLQRLLWSSIILLLGISERLQTQNEFLDEIEDRIFS